MKLIRVSNSTLAVSDVSDIISKKYAPTPIDLSSLRHVGTALVSKAAQKRILAPPYDMKKLLNLTDLDEYHAACLDAIVNSTIIHVQCSNTQVTKWLKNAEYPVCESETTILREFLFYYLACGNGFMIKMRSATGAWAGLERILPSNVQIIEEYDEYGFLRPNYVQTSATTKRDHPYRDIIHLKNSSHHSSAWGLSCLPIAINIEILGEIKTFDFNNFRNGLMVDYFIIVEGGSLRDGAVLDADGNEVVQDAYSEIERVLQDVKGNPKSHSTILIESENPNVKIRLEPLRQQERDGGFISLKKDLREGIFAYHRVPPRIVSQLIPGQLGGSDKSDMLIFYNFVVRPLQTRLAEALAQEFVYEFGWNVSPTDFDFGSLTDALQDADEILFRQNRNF